MQLTLTKDTKVTFRSIFAAVGQVLRPEHTLSESGLYDRCVVTAIRHPEHRPRCLRVLLS